MIRIQWVFLSATLIAASDVRAQLPTAPQTLRYTFISNGTKSGSEVDTYGAGGRVDSAYEYNDRGRGPKVEAHWILAADGTPQRLDVTGVDYLKAPVDEHFSVAQGQAEWKSASEHGHAAAGGFYAGINSPPLEPALLVRRLVRAGTEGVPLYPSGVAHLEKVQETTVHNASGASMHVTEYAITGLTFDPLELWLDDQMQFFGTPGSWSALLREGWEQTNDALYALQVKAEQERYHRLAVELTRRPQHAVAIEHVRVFDAPHAAMLDDQTVVVEGDRIRAVGPAAKVQAPADAERIDGRGKTLLPGLFDMHNHVQGGLDGILNIASGVTSIRDMGNGIDVLQRQDERWSKGLEIGPRLWKAGLIDGPGPYQAPTGLFAGTQAEANAAVNRYADLGYIQTKL
ncbi:MAG TPA: hypothetical protein VHC72_14345, partial [Bryobacteraceae bacterium]|nr:hypothetical protein [Bryobacteraceae bacterium]